MMRINRRLRCSNAPVVHFETFLVGFYYQLVVDADLADSLTMTAYLRPCSSNYAVLSTSVLPARDSRSALLQGSGQLRARNISNVTSIAHRSLSPLI